MAEEDLSVIDDGRDNDMIREILQQHDIMQFFYPPPDALALGLVERGLGQVRVDEQVTRARKLGHPRGQMEIVPPETRLTELMETLKDLNYLAEGEISYELTPEGEAHRTTVRYRPREGVVSKLLNRISVNIDLKDLFRPGSM